MNDLIETQVQTHLTQNAVPEPDPILITASFAGKLYKKLAESRKDQNFVFSPFSLQMALAMCATGAKGATQKALLALVGIAETVEEQNEKLRTSLESTTSRYKESIQFAIANGICVRKGIPIKPEYQETIAHVFDGAAFQIDFINQPRQSIQQINDWISKKTQGKFTNLVDEKKINDSVMAWIFNTIYFKCCWDRPFDKKNTRHMIWHGKKFTKNTNFMYTKFNSSYYECNSYQVAQIPYCASCLSMVIVLPNESTALEALENQWSLEDIYDRFSKESITEEVKIWLPRCQIESDYNLGTILQDLSSEIPYTENADFSNVADLDGPCFRKIWLSDLIHQTVIDVDEEGTEAAAVTWLTFFIDSASLEERTPKIKKFRANRPFLFFIRSFLNDTIFFAGRVMDP